MPFSDGASLDDGDYWALAKQSAENGLPGRFEEYLNQIRDPEMRREGRKWFEMFQDAQNFRAKTLQEAQHSEMPQESRFASASDKQDALRSVDAADDPEVIPRQKHVQEGADAADADPAEEAPGADAPPEEEACPSCGAPVSASDEACPSCGAPLGASEAQSPGDTVSGTPQASPETPAQPLQAAPEAAGSAESGDTAGAPTDPRPPHAAPRPQSAQSPEQQTKDEQTRRTTTQAGKAVTNFAVDRTADAFAAETGGASKVAGEVVKAKLGSAMEAEEKAQREGASTDAASMFTRNALEGAKEGAKSAFTFGMSDKDGGTKALAKMGMQKLGMKGGGDGKTSASDAKQNLAQVKQMLANPAQLAEMVQKVGKQALAAVIRVAAKEATASYLRPVAAIVLVLVFVPVLVSIMAAGYNEGYLGNSASGSGESGGAPAAFAPASTLRASAGIAATEPSKLLGLTAPLVLALNACGDEAPIAVTFGVGGAPGTAHYDGRAVRLSTKALPPERVAALEQCLEREADPCVEDLLGPDPSTCVSSDADVSCEVARAAQVDRSGGEIFLSLRASCTPTAQIPPPPSSPPL